MPTQAVQDIVAVEDFARLFGQHAQQFKLSARQLDQLSLAQHCVRVQVNLQTVKNQPMMLGHSASAPQHGLQACHQLTRLKRLGQIVISPQFQANDAIHHITARGQHDDGNIACAITTLANGAAQLKAIHLGQHHVQNCGVKMACPQLGQTSARPVRERERQVKPLKVHRQRWPELLVIINQQDIRHGALSPSRDRPFKPEPGPTRGPPTPHPLLTRPSRVCGSSSHALAVAERGSDCQKSQRQPQSAQGSWL